jgi:hypothetical protein
MSSGIDCSSIRIVACDKYTGGNQKARKMDATRMGSAILTQSDFRRPRNASPSLTDGALLTFNDWADADVFILASIARES